MSEPTAFVELVVLLLAAAVARRLLLRDLPSPASAGAIVMTGGIFGLAALQTIPGAAAATQPFALGLLVIWLLIAASYVRACLQGGLAAHSAPPLGRFAVGTWVAGTAVLLELILFAIPAWRPLALALGLIALGLWLWYVRLAASGFAALSARPTQAPVPGLVLLATVSTQALALAALALFPGQLLVQRSALALIALGYAAYFAALPLILRSHLGHVRLASNRRQPGPAKSKSAPGAAGWTLADGWHNSNCILHGAMSISGLAAVTDGLMPAVLPLLTWLYVALAFVLVEGIELARAGARVRVYGWHRALAVYDPSQWSRTFTFGMLYAFTLAFARKVPLPAGWSWLGAAQGWVLAYGQYLVLLLLVAEVLLFLEDRIDRDALADLMRRGPSGRWS